MFQLLEAYRGILVKRTFVLAGVVTSLFIEASQADWLAVVEEDSKKERERAIAERMEESKQLQRFYEQRRESARAAQSACRFLISSGNLTIGAIEDISKKFAVDPSTVRLQRVIYQDGMCLAVVYHQRGVVTCRINPSGVAVGSITNLKECE